MTSSTEPVQEPGPHSQSPASVASSGLVEFTIPSLPESMNGIYNVLFSLKRVELKPQVRLWKSEAKQFIPKWKWENGRLLQVELEFHGNWWYKNGKVKKMDLANLEKVVLDAIAEKMGFDDSYFFRKITSKLKWDQKEKVVCRVGYLEDPTISDGA